MFATRGVSGVSVCQKYFNERETMKKELRKGGSGRNKAKKSIITYGLESLFLYLKSTALIKRM